MPKVKPYVKTYTASSSRLKPSEPLELLKSKKYPDEEEFHRKAFLAYMTYRDRELPENECVKETANICKMAESTIKSWKSKFGWEDRYDEHISNILLLVAASYQPELRKHAHSIIASLHATRIDIDLKTQQYFMELETYKSELEEYKAQPSGAKKKSAMPKLPKPPFEVSSLGGLAEYTKILKLFIGDDNGESGPDLKKWSEEELRKLVSIGNVENLQIVHQNPALEESHQEHDVLDAEAVDLPTSS